MAIRFLFVFVFLINTFTVFSQELNGKVVDATSQLPISGVQVISHNATTTTNEQGFFRLAKVQGGQKIGFRVMGYETYEITFSNDLTDTLRIGLKPNKIIVLNEVTIKTARNYKLDSLKLRKEYAREFNFKGPSIMDMFIQRSPNARSNLPYANSTASLVGVNLLQVFGALGKKKQATTRLREALLRDEEANYINQFFSKEKIEELTPLRGDSLLRFMQKYRPSILQAKSMSGYEMVLYIKRSFTEFSKSTPIKE